MHMSEAERLGWKGMKETARQHIDVYTRLNSDSVLKVTSNEGEKESLRLSLSICSSII